MSQKDELSPELVEYGLFLKYLHDKWSPHEYQRKIIEDLLVNDKKIVFLNCGRKFGKTEVILYCIWRWAYENPGSIIYYVSQTEESARDIIWKNGRLQTFGPREALKPNKEGIKESSGSIHFANGSSVWLKGSNADPDSLVGVTPDLVIYDEYARHNPLFHINMDPNLAPRDAPLLILSTPPPLEAISSGKAKFYQEMIDLTKKGKEYSYYNRPSFDNPNENVQKFLKRKKQELLAVGKEYAWEREYMAKIVLGSEDSIFPELTTSDLTPHADVMAMVAERRDDLEWWVAVDPSGMKRWGVLFVAADPYSKKVYVLDNLALDSKNAIDKQQMSVTSVHDYIINVTEQLNPEAYFDDWSYIYDSAEAWYANEVYAQVSQDITITPSNKNRLSRMQGLTTIRDLKKAGRLVVSDRCTALMEELQALQFDPNNEMPKKEFDELIDCLRYVLYDMEHIFYNEYQRLKQMKDWRKMSDSERVFENSRLAQQKRTEERTNRMYNLDEGDDTLFDGDALWM